MLVSTHNLGSVPEFCDRTVLVKETVLAYGPTETTFTSPLVVCCVTSCWVALTCTTMTTPAPSA